jgi:succinate dehydrogenase / fumarate reductase cytochrome b subunit
MSTLRSFFFSSIGKKYLVTLTAIVWSLFVMAHMAGNMLIFVGPEAYNRYAHALTANPAIYAIEAFLLIALLIHAGLALSLKVRNVVSKPTQYAVTPQTPKGAPVSSKTMAYTGSLVLAFIIWHLITFKFGPMYTVEYDGQTIRDLYTLVIEKFSEPFYAFSYAVIMVLIGVHLYHGVKSIFQTLGMNHPKYNNFFKYFGYTYAIVVAAGFISQPLFVYFFAR